MTPNGAPLRFLSRGETNIYGPTASGRTRICINVAMNAIKKGLNVLYLDTERGLEYWTLVEVAKAFGYPENTIVATPDGSYAVGGKLLVKLTPTMDLLAGEVMKLQNMPVKPNLLILDDLTSHYIVLQCGETKYGKPAKQMEVLLGQLKIYTNQWNLAVLAVSREASEVAKTVRAEMLAKGEIVSTLDYLEDIGGHAIGYNPKVKIALHILDKNRRKAVIFKHRTKPRGLSCEFVINQFGVGDVGV